MKHFLHRLSEFLHVPQSWRNSSVALWKRLTRRGLPYYRRANTFGLHVCPARTNKITISLTSYPARIKTVHETINTLLTQTVKPDRVVLWLAREQFPNGEDSLPCELLKLKKLGLSPMWCNDIKSFKKLIPSLKTFPNDIIITVDDDILYDSTLVERLYNSYLRDKSNIHSQLVLRIDYQDEKVGPYNGWKLEHKPSTSYLNLLMGGSGTLYPPHVMPDLVWDEEIFMEIAPTADDIWFWAMATLAGHKIHHIADGTQAYFIQNPAASMREALWNVNMNEMNGNDSQLARILSRYPLIGKRIAEEVAGQRVNKLGQ